MPRFASDDKDAVLLSLNIALLNLARPVLDYVLPPRCPGCGNVVDADHRFCAPCWDSLDFLTGAGCARCSIPLGINDGQTCGPCLGTPSSFDGVIAAVAYGDIARRVALRLKYGRRTGLARTIANVLSPRLDVAGALFIPVPLHRWRLWSRGFNQSQAIGASLAKGHSALCRSDLLVRARATPPLRGMNGTERRRTVKNAFAVTARLEGQHVFLIDDVFTTGATADACARALKRAGAGRVTVVCWTRVIRDD